jgi:hypothetical protein
MDTAISTRHAAQPNAHEGFAACLARKACRRHEFSLNPLQIAALAVSVSASSPFKTPHLASFMTGVGRNEKGN